MNSAAAPEPEYPKLDLDVLPPNLKQSTLEHLVKADGIGYIAERYWTEDLAIAAVKRTRLEALDELPESVKTESFYKRLIRLDTKWSAIKKTISVIPTDHINQSLVLFICQYLAYDAGKVPLLLQRLPEQYRGIEFITVLCKTVPCITPALPSNMLTVDIVKGAIKCDNNLIRHFYRAHTDLIEQIEDKFWNQIVLNNSQAIEFIPQAKVTPQMAEAAVYDTWVNVPNIPPNCWTEKMIQHLDNIGKREYAVFYAPQDLLNQVFRE